MTVYGNYDVIAFKSCIQIFTVWIVPKTRSMMGLLLIKYAKDSHNHVKNLCFQNSSILVKKNLLELFEWIRFNGYVLITQSYYPFNAKR